MRRFVYTLAAVVALAPLAAITPASAAVQSPIAAQTLCDGHQVVFVYNYVNGVQSDWYTPHGTINDSGSLGTNFCLLPEGKYSNNNVYAFRQLDTSGCATFDSATNQVDIENCNPSGIASQNWQMTHPGQSPQQGAFWTLYQAEGGINKDLEGDGGDTPVYFHAPDGSTDQYWYIQCELNC